MHCIHTKHNFVSQKWKLHSTLNDCAMCEFMYLITFAHTVWNLSTQGLWLVPRSCADVFPNHELKTLWWSSFTGHTLFSVQVQTSTECLIFFFYRSQTAFLPLYIIFSRKTVLMDWLAVGHTHTHVPALAWMNLKSSFVKQVMHNRLSWAEKLGHRNNPNKHDQATLIPRARQACIFTAKVPNTVLCVSLNSLGHPLLSS